VPTISETPVKSNNYGNSGTTRRQGRLTQVALLATAVGSFAGSLESRLRIRNGGAMVSEDFRKQALGYGLTTAHILYRRPRVAHCRLIKPADLRAIDGEFRLH